MPSVQSVTSSWASIVGGGTTQSIVSVFGADSPDICSPNDALATSVNVPPAPAPRFGSRGFNVIDQVPPELVTVVPV